MKSVRYVQVLGTCEINRDTVVDGRVVCDLKGAECGDISIEKDSVCSVGWDYAPIKISGRDG